jgi:hypothetical protein
MGANRPYPRHIAKSVFRPELVAGSD